MKSTSRAFQRLSPIQNQSSNREEIRKRSKDGRIGHACFLKRALGTLRQCPEPACTAPMARTTGLCGTRVAVGADKANMLHGAH